MTNHQNRNTEFDFLLGSWTIAIHRRRCLFQGCDDWENFAATSRVESILGGSGHIEHITGEFPDGSPLHGLNFRLYNPRSNQWSCHWSDSRSHELHPSTVGTFDHDQAVFHGVTTSGKRTIDIRSTWTGVHAEAPRWFQEMSLDGGKTWESNWEMEFARIPDWARTRQLESTSVGRDFAVDVSSFQLN